MLETVKSTVTDPLSAYSYQAIAQLIMLFEEPALISLQNHVNQSDERHKRKRKCLNCRNDQGKNNRHHSNEIRHTDRSPAVYFHMPASGSLLDDYGHAHSKFENDYAKALDEEQEQQGNNRREPILCKECQSLQEKLKSVGVDSLKVTNRAEKYISAPQVKEKDVPQKCEFLVHQKPIKISIPLKYREGRGLLEVLEDIEDSATNTEESQNEEEEEDLPQILKPQNMIGFRNYYSDWRDGINFHRVPPLSHQQQQNKRPDQFQKPYRPLSRVKRSFHRIQSIQSFIKQNNSQSLESSYYESEYMSDSNKKVAKKEITNQQITQKEKAFEQTDQAQQLLLLDSLDLYSQQSSSSSEQQSYVSSSNMSSSFDQSEEDRERPKHVTNQYPDFASQQVLFGVAASGLFALSQISQKNPQGMQGKGEDRLQILLEEEPQIDLRKKSKHNLPLSPITEEQGDNREANPPIDFKFDITFDEDYFKLQPHFKDCCIGKL
ncbi:hypothetical protein FGO68_gene4914 [Halteria grandinella]|uniref:Uncharacterized protein n=1 Tax=Halteria grandinella TaxID=5974 RepID=A0A8J8P0B0_HALGN|nr:hypothetical protein FGO68_gene4914 [Halteria grandinella]